MRSIVLAAALVAGCATVDPSPESVIGCWVQRGPRDAAVTMRWLPDTRSPGSLRGDYLSSPNGERRLYSLTPDDAGRWTFCHTGEIQNCWRVARGSGGSLEGGRAFIDLYREGLRIAIIDGQTERIIFQGTRDGCD